MNAALIESLFATGSLAGLGPERRPEVDSAAELEDRLRSIRSTGALPGPAAECLHALALVWHDHLDDAHARVQDLAGADAAWVHGIIHRREPDYSNARYWFHRVGAHEALEALADAAAPVLAEHAALPYRLIRDGRWDPFAFVDAVSAASRLPSTAPELPLLCRIQQVEIQVLGRHLAGI